MSTIRLLIVDDHAVVRVGLRTMLAAEPDIEVVGEAAGGEQAVRMVAAHRPDVVILDIRMAGMDGITACRHIVTEVPGTAVLMLTSFGTQEAVLAALLAGAAGFMLKNSGIDELVHAVRVVASGQSLLDPAVTRQVTAKLIALASSVDPPELTGLSPREREVLVRLAHGETNREIAARLVISEATARNHVSNVLSKLGLSRRTEAAALAARLGLLDDEQ